LVPQDPDTLNQLISAVRKEFPRVETDGNGRPRIYFENAAGSLVLKRAADEEMRTRILCSANVGGPTWESKMNEEIILKGRRDVRDLMNAPSEECIVSGESCTSLLFQLSYAIGKELGGEGNIVATEYEHYANLSPWLELQRRGLVKEVRLARFDPLSAELDLSHFESLVDDNTKIISVAGVSNVLGSKSPLAQLLRIAKKTSAYTVLDAVHSVAHIPIDVQKTSFDFVVFSAYKLFSRRGSFMYGRKDLLSSLKPYKVLPSPEEVPLNWEMGTRDQSLFASISAVMDYLEWLGSNVQKQFEEKTAAYSGRRRLLKAALSWIEEYEQSLSLAMLQGTKDQEGLGSIDRVEVYGVTDPAKVNLRVPTFTFNIEGTDPRKVAEYLWDKHAIALIAENGGGFYSRTLKTYGKSIAVRASPVHFNTIQEIGEFLRALKECVEHFRT
jgi:selenocysteine lyase/cysteine desulfurase